MFERLDDGMVERLVRNREVQLAREAGWADANVLPACLEVAVDCAGRLIIAILGLVDVREQIV